MLAGKPSRLLLFLVCVLLAGMVAGRSQARSNAELSSTRLEKRSPQHRLKSCWNQGYLDLLAKFPVEQQGYGPEPSLFPPDHQPMTYGLVLSSEVLRYKSCPSREGQVRIRAAALWLMANSDLDQDQKPGWGLPIAWDAFADEVVNPANHPYTITTAVVIEGLLGAYSLIDVFSEQERAALGNLLRLVALRWTDEVWLTHPTGGYFLYSPSEHDNYFTPNVSAYMLGMLQALIQRQPDLFRSEELSRIQARVDLAAATVVAVVDKRNGHPLWPYILDPRKAPVPNSSVHHAYIIWGMGNYRENGGKVALSWSTQDSVDSVGLFFKENHLYDLPQDVVYEDEALQNRPARLWGAGMMLAFEARYGDPARADIYLASIEQDYGELPNLRVWPPNFINDPNFYPRFASHVLFGIAYQEFYPAPSHGPEVKVFLPLAYIR